MCHQAVGLVQGELERCGITTASVTMLPEITRRVRPPRAVAVPFALGYPLGKPDAPGLQRAVVCAMLGICAREDVPLLEPFGVPRP